MPLGPSLFAMLAFTGSMLGGSPGYKEELRREEPRTTNIQPWLISQTAQTINC